jgi:hypothetical protein
MRDKQIEEMVKHCHFYEDGNCILCEELWVECDAKCDMCEFAKQLYNAGYRKKSDVVRDIFEEIDTLIVRRMIPDIAWIDDRFITDIAKLKKKYESEEIK